MAHNTPMTKTGAVKLYTRRLNAFKKEIKALRAGKGNAGKAKRKGGMCYEVTGDCYFSADERSEMLATLRKLVHTLAQLTR